LFSAEGGEVLQPCRSGADCFGAVHFHHSVGTVARAFKPSFTVHAILCPRARECLALVYVGAARAWFFGEA
jgi:hypothetical protein